MVELYLSGLVNTTFEGMSHIIESSCLTLQVLVMTLNDQPEMSGKVCKAISYC